MTTADLVPAGHGFASPASIVIDASSSVAKIDSWSLDILDPSGKVFRSFSDKWPQNVASWDGLSSGGAQAAPVTTYKATAKVRDEFGNVGIHTRGRSRGRSALRLRRDLHRGA